MIFRKFLILALLSLTACGGGMRDLMLASEGLPVHGASAGGYGAVPFGTPKEYVAQLFQNRGFWSYSTEDPAAMMVTYYDRFGYYPVQVYQHFTKKGMAGKAEVYLSDAVNAVDQGSCEESFEAMLQMLKERHGSPDWSPKYSESGGGKHGVTSYTFSDTSNIQLEYHYNLNSQGQNCKVWMTYVPSLGWEGAS